MKTKTICSVSALVFAAVMLFFTFFTWGWFSDDRGFQTGFEIPVGTKFGALGTFADIVYLIAPVLLLVAAALSFRRSPDVSVVLPLSCVPLMLYVVLQFILALTGEKTLPLPLIGTLLALFFLGLATLVCASGKIKGLPLSLFWLWYAALELFLALLSIFTNQRVSAFYFAQLLPFGGGTLSYSYFVLSVFLYHLTYPVAVFFCLRAACGGMAKKESV